MNLILTSNFPSEGNELVFEHLKTVRPESRVLVIPPGGDAPQDALSKVSESFRHHGFVADIHARAERLSAYDIIYLTGGNPLVFQQNIKRTGLAQPLGEFLEDGGVLVGASGGAMELTLNVSLFRLVAESLEDTLQTRDQYNGLGFASYEVLPHLNRFDDAFKSKVREYSQAIPHEIIALNDGAAIIHTSPHSFHPIGSAVRIRGGSLSEL
jgi:peptidase E